MSEQLDTDHIQIKDIPKKERWKKKRKIFQMIRFIFLGTVLTFAKGDTENPKKAALNLFSSETLNSQTIGMEDELKDDGEQPESRQKETSNVQTEEKLDVEDVSSDQIVIEEESLDEDTVIEKAHDEVVVVENEMPIESTAVEEEVMEQSPGSDAEIIATEDAIFDPSQKLKGGEYTEYIIDNYSEQSVGISLDNQTDQLLSPKDTNNVINNVFLNDPFMKSVVSMFYPNMSETDITDYLTNFQIVAGEKVNHYLTIIRHGSWGTTIATFTENGELKFETISLKSDLLNSNYIDDEWGSLKRLVREEFFQAHQYNTFAELYNNGYLQDVAGFETISDIIQALSDGNLRAFLELFPQQKILSDEQVGGNAYNFYIGDDLYTGYPAANETIDTAYNVLTDFIYTDLGIYTSPELFLDPQFIIKINNTFREKHLQMYLDLGFQSKDVQIWNLVGMYRFNNNPENSLDMRALLPLP